MHVHQDRRDLDVTGCTALPFTIDIHHPRSEPSCCLSVLGRNSGLQSRGTASEERWLGMCLSSCLPFPKFGEIISATGEMFSVGVFSLNPRF